MCVSACVRVCECVSVLACVRVGVCACVCVWLFMCECFANMCDWVCVCVGARQRQFKYFLF